MNEAPKDDVQDLRDYLAAHGITPVLLFDASLRSVVFDLWHKQILEIVADDAAKVKQVTQLILQITQTVRFDEKQLLIKTALELATQPTPDGKAPEPTASLLSLFGLPLDPNSPDAKKFKAMWDWMAGKEMPHDQPL